MDDKIAVSVIILTYNHENYISKALDSVLLQRTDFVYEILIGDDASCDDTRKLLVDYQTKYPDIIRLVLRSQNVGIIENSIQISAMAKGKYIAWLEGDNYWLGENKLQKQYDFLENNPSYSMCSGRCEIVNQAGEPIDLPFVSNCMFHGGEFQSQDYSKEWLPGHANTYFFRNIYVNKSEMPHIMHEINGAMGDETMVALLLQYGKIYQMDDTMSAWRYICKENGVNWNSVVASNPYKEYEIFLYYCRLEKAIKQHWNNQIDIKRQKTRRLFKFIESAAQYKNVSLEFCITKMLEETDHKLYYRREISKYKRFQKLRDDINLPPFLYQLLKEKEEYTKNNYYERSTFENFEKHQKGKKVILFGAGIVGDNFLMKYYPKYKIEFIVDNNLNKQGQALRGVLIRSPKELDKTKDAIVLVTNYEYEKEIFHQLESITDCSIYSYCSMEYHKLQKPNRKIRKGLQLEDTYRKRWEMI